MRFRWLSQLFVPVLVAAVTCSGTLAVFDLQNEQTRDANRSAAVRRAGAEAVALQRQLDRTLNAPIALAAFIQLNDGRIDGFHEFTDRMRGLVPSITNLQLAPDGVVTYVHPLEGAEAAIGHELLVDRDRSTEAFVAVETRQLTLAGPFELVQGGVAMVGRQPIYLPGAGNVAGLDPDFWGFATVLIDLDDFFEASRIEELLDEGYRFEIAKLDRDENQFVPFRTEGPIEDPVRVDVSVANGTWQLALGRPEGWGVSGWSALQLITSILFALSAGIAAHRFHRRRDRLVAAVEARTQELRFANVELVRARDTAEQANQAKTAFLSNVSHELRTPMNAIIGFAELIELENLTAADTESMTQIRQASGHLLELINEVLDIAAIESGNLELELATVDVGNLIGNVHDLLSPLADAEGVVLQVEGSGSVALAHESRLFQVVSNLTANALRFTPPGGNVHISTSMTCGSCQIAVTDNGVGIASDQVEQIFKPFERGHAPDTVAGTGLGLAIVAKLTEAMGGQVRVDSKVGVGSTFTVTLSQPGTTIATDDTSLSQSLLVETR